MAKKQNLEMQAATLNTQATSEYELFDFDLDGISDVCPVDIGQGNATAIYDTDGSLVLYKDYGGLINRPNDVDTRLAVEVRDPQGVVVGHAAIVISHWDKDHFESAYHVQDAREKCQWLAPRQRVGPMAVDFSNLLTADGTPHGPSNLSLWGYNQLVVKWEVGADCLIFIERCTGTIPANPIEEEERNHTGLSMTLMRKKAGQNNDYHAILLPGDAPYKYIRTLTEPNNVLPIDVDGVFYVGLVAYHHGAHTHWGQETTAALPAPASNASMLVFSYGVSNTYGHPDAARYIDNGWPSTTHCRTARLRNHAQGHDRFVIRL